MSIRSILVTGGAGFIGSNSVEYFIRKGCRITVLDNLGRKGGDVNLRRLHSLKAGSRLRIVRGDIRHQGTVQAAFRKAGRLDAVLHLAGQVAVTTSVVDPRDDFESNALGTFNVLEAARRIAPKTTLLFASTNKVYGSLPGVRVTERSERYALVSRPMGVSESEPLDFHSPYGCSKGAADQYVHDYSRIYGLKTVVLRQSCIYGPNQLGIEDQGWVAWFTIAAVLGWPLTVYGNGKQVRDLLYIDDLVRLYDTCISHPTKAAGKIYNVGGGPQFTYSLIELIKQLEDRLGHALRIRHSTWRPGDQPIYVSDIRRLKRELGWSPRVSPTQGVDQLLAWVRDHRTMLGALLGK